MQVGDLVKWSGWKYPMIIVGIRHDVYFRGGSETYYRCLAGEDYIWLFESSLETIIN